jgi:hypothetical protein
MEEKKKKKKSSSGSPRHTHTHYFVEWSYLKIPQATKKKKKIANYKFEQKFDFSRYT